ncbi:hypothetical protein G7B40_026795 [Aetokthonos hydrillicola Thurmond2011]|jgi:hypothetical protein|uniref:Uncharacterized protein n=1 Tax=Aetokthonos hydrillicola Thurmond2011 TaxID=2712845 RepID=A0AAP5MCJ8_9CYAN|nr:hypothetical protein [Aetokthonos hydrillicola]MBO3461622.1 hypothetical protein [Aetokthonos hydrillicola CCALA 1050]MBW4589323.1 hypothetical protein [Aetokthonos hydrillicola CCALA 1050]MDR9898144.1 hypothetical protein [Aetokthonos hydrillicola Thurmond2011]
MTQALTVRQILSDNDTGLLSYIRDQLVSKEFSHFRAQMGFYVDEYCTRVGSGKESSELQTTLFITLKFLIVTDNQTSPDDATLHALEFQQMLDAQLVNWSQRNKHNIEPISEITGKLSNLEEIRYHGGYLPGFEIQRKFALTY